MFQVLPCQLDHGDGVSALCKPAMSCVQCRVCDIRNSGLQDTFSAAGQNYQQLGRNLNNGNPLYILKLEMRRKVRPTYKDTLIKIRMYGLYQAPLETRQDTTGPTINRVRAAILHAWHNYFLPRTITRTHLIKPQDRNNASMPHVYLIVEFANRIIAFPHRDAAVLKKIVWEGVWNDDKESTAEYHTPGISAIHLSTQYGCRSGTTRLCTVYHIRSKKRIVPPLEMTSLRHRSQLEIFIH